MLASLRYNNNEEKFVIIIAQPQKWILLGLLNTTGVNSMYLLKLIV